ncbi:MAG TPA: pilus assembly protein TadG-related protein [Terracidiphilus sp.]|jgi:Flp pilus assembly protein TadG
MKTIRNLLNSEFLKDQSGQSLPLVAAFLVGFLAVAGLTIDLGHCYVVRGQLQNATNAAALAAAGVVYNTSSTDNASTFANNFSSKVSGNKNYDARLGTVNVSVTPKCLNMLLASGTCGTSSPNNAVQVVQDCDCNTWFLRLLGIHSISVSSSATASMLGLAQPWNVAIIVDSTGSMATTDTNCGGVTEFQCALSGVQTLLAATNPACPPNVSNCPSGVNFRVSLFTFPNILTKVNGATPTVTVNGTTTTIDSISKDINCGGSPGSYLNWQNQPLAAPYTLPMPGASLPQDSTGRTYLTYVQTSTGTTWNATYQVTPFLSDYYDASTSSGLNSGSDLVKAVGYGTTPGCLTYTFGIDGPDGGGSHFGNTYFASSIYAAQSALAAEQAANPGSKNAIIFLSDGQANASMYSRNPSTYGTVNSTNQYSKAYQFPEAPAGSEVGPSTLNYSTPTSTYPVPAYLTPATILPAQASLGYDTLSSSPAGGTRSGSSTGVYPDWNDQCQQAIIAAQYAINAGTIVYSVAYGPESSGCSNGWNVGATDTTRVATGTYNQSFSGNSVLPCTTMEDVASSWSNFYSDNQQSANVNLGCSDLNHTTVSLQNIFQAIAASFTRPRLLPNNAHN